MKGIKFTSVNMKQRKDLSDLDVDKRSELSCEGVKWIQTKKFVSTGKRL